MTTISVPPLPRLGTARLTWRQHRAAVLAVVAVLAALGAFLVLTGLQLHASYQRFGLDRCHSITVGSVCDRLSAPFSTEYGQWGQVESTIVFLPGLLGMFLGAPLVARELETGTYRFAWTQGAGRTRWLVTKLVLLAVVLAAATLAFSALYSWWRGPIDAITGTRLGKGTAFEGEGIVFTARALLAFSLGTLAGAVLRRTVPAMVVTFAVWVGVVVSTAFLLRPHYERPVTAVQGAVYRRAGFWNVDAWYTDPSGHRVGAAAEDTLTARLTRQHVDPYTWLTGHGYTLWHSYQPADRFWPFQLIEASGLLALAAGCAAAGVWWIRRRTN